MTSRVSRLRTIMDRSVRSGPVAAPPAAGPTPFGGHGAQGDPATRVRRGPYETASDSLPQGAFPQSKRPGSPEKAERACRHRGIAVEATARPEDASQAAGSSSPAPAAPGTGSLSSPSPGSHSLSRRERWLDLRDEHTRGELDDDEAAYRTMVLLGGRFL